MEGIKRELFPILQNKRYFNTCSIGALSIIVKEAIFDFTNQWDTEGGVSWMMENGWTDHVEKARDLFAQIIGAKSENVAFMFGNSTAISAIMSAFNFKKRNEIVFNELDFPAIPKNIMARSDIDSNIKLKIVESSKNGEVTTDSYRNKINKKTGLVTACEVLSNTGYRINVDELTELSHENGSPVFIDTYQSTGYIPLDVKKTDVDFLASGCLKWLLGGFGISFLYIRDDLMDELQPGSIGWYGVADPFLDLFDKLQTTLKRPKDATKFQFGTPYPIGAFTAIKGMEMVQEIGIQKIFNQNMNITQEIIEKASDNNLSIATPVDKNKRGSIINIPMKNADKIVNLLQKNNYILDMRANGIRVSPHFYNNSEDVDNLITDIIKFQKQI